jgi:hypothetical protein
VDRLPILSLLILFAKYARDLLPLPTWEDSASVREWAKKVVSALTSLATKTTTAIDDTAVATLAKIVESAEAWEAFYSLVKRMFTREKEVAEAMGTSEWDGPVLTASDQVDVENVAMKAGVDPATIAVILQLIQQFAPLVIEWIKNRRKKEAEPQPAI